MINKMTVPNFLFIGPDKSGSTWLYKILYQHPQCFVPYCKDIYFFDRYYDRGMKWYLSFFKNVPIGVKAIGELSHDYLFSGVAAKRIKNELPGVTLITILRNPVERTFSHYLHWLSRGLTKDDFETAIEKHSEFLNNSMYYKHLSNYYKYFDVSKIKILFFRELKENPEKFAKNVFESLNVNFDYDIDYQKIVLPASRSRVPLLTKTVRKCANVVRSIGYPNLVGSIKFSLIARFLYRTYNPSERPKMHDETRKRLIDVFRSDILKLQDLIDMDLGVWLAYEGREYNV